jgi:hypothetical protein
MFYQNKLALRNTADMTGGKPIAVLSQSISGVSAINPLVAFYEKKEGKERGAILLFCTGHHTRHIYYYIHYACLINRQINVLNTYTHGHLVQSKHL